MPKKEDQKDKASLEAEHFRLNILKLMDERFDLLKLDPDILQQVGEGYDFNSPEFIEWYEANINNPEDVRTLAKAELILSRFRWWRDHQDSIAVLREIAANEKLNNIIKEGNLEKFKQQWNALDLLEQTQIETAANTLYGIKAANCEVYFPQIENEVSLSEELQLLIISVKEENLEEFKQTLKDYVQLLKGLKGDEEHLATVAVATLLLLGLDAEQKKIAEEVAPEIFSKPERAE